MVPTAYTEAELAAYMHSELRGTAADLGWAVPAGGSTGGYGEAVTATLLAYGVADVADASDIQRLRLLATREVWRAVMAETVGWTNITGVDGASDARAAVAANARAMYGQAAQAVAEYVAALPSAQASPARRPVTASVPVEVGW